MDSPADITQLSHSLHRLSVQQGNTAQVPTAPHENGETEDVTRTPPASHTPIRDGYGFRRSGVSTPTHPPDNTSSRPRELGELVLDNNGLGWPGN